MDRYIEFLEEISDTFGPECCAYWVGPNVVLTLSGERAYCDSVFWSEDLKKHDKWREDIAKTSNTLKKYLDLEVCEITEDRSLGSKHTNYTSYDIVTRLGLLKINESSLLKKSYKITKEEMSIQTIFEQIELCLSDDIRKEFNKESLNHIVHGILLGYPEKAIIESIRLDSRYGNIGPGHFDETSVNADIRGASYYSCPQPVYSYPRSLVGDTDIVAHEKRWSSLLEDFYTSKFHQKLQKNKSFNAKIKELSE